MWRWAPPTRRPLRETSRYKAGIMESEELVQVVSGKMKEVEIMKKITGNRRFKTRGCCGQMGKRTGDYIERLYGFSLLFVVGSKLKWAVNMAISKTGLDIALGFVMFHAKYWALLCFMQSL